MREHQAGKSPESQLGDAVSDTPAHGWAGIDKTVFGVSLVIVVAVCILGVFFTDAIGDAAGTALGWVTSTFG